MNIHLNRLDNHQPVGDISLPLLGHNEVSQTFVSGHNNLNIVYLCLRNPAKSQLPLRFELRGGDQEIIRALDFNAANIDNRDCTRLQFEPIPDSSDKPYTVSIVTGEYTLDQSLYVEAHAGADFQSGTALLDGQDTTYDLHFKTSYYQSLSDAGRESTTQFVGRLIQDPAFFILYTITIVYLLINLFKKRHEA